MRHPVSLSAAVLAATLLASAPALAFHGGGGFHGGGFGGFHGGGFNAGGFHPGGFNAGVARGGWANRGYANRGFGRGWGVAAGVAGLGLGLAATAPYWGYDAYYPYDYGYGCYPGYPGYPGYGCPYYGYGY